MPPAAVSPSAASTSVSASTMPTSVESKQSDDSDTVPFTNVEDLLKVIDGTIRAGRDSLTVTSTVSRYYFYMMY
jgi:hypothetical protein